MTTPFDAIFDEPARFEAARKGFGNVELAKVCAVHCALVGVAAAVGWLAPGTVPEHGGNYALPVLLFPVKLSSLDAATISRFEAESSFTPTNLLVALHKDHPGVTGVCYGLGDRGEPVVLVLVQTKRDAEVLRRVLGAGPGGTDFEVRVVGVCRGLTGPGNDELQPRPVSGGSSIGVIGKETGTMACRVKRASGTKSRYFVLSCSHVLAFGGTKSGDLIVQPGPADSLITADREVAKFKQAIAFGATNKVDAAIGSVLKGKVSAGVLGIGPVTSWRAAADVAVGLAVQRSGRVAPYVRTGTVDGVNASIFVTINGQSLLFVEQLLLSEMASPGDSGALLMATDGSAVGLIFAAGQGCTYANAIENVQTALNVTVADTKWT